MNIVMSLSCGHELNIRLTQRFYKDLEELLLEILPRTAAEAVSPETIMAMIGGRGYVVAEPLARLSEFGYMLSNADSLSELGLTMAKLTNFLKKLHKAGKIAFISRDGLSAYYVSNPSVPHVRLVKPDSKTSTKTDVPPYNTSLGVRSGEGPLPITYHYKEKEMRRVREGKKYFYKDLANLLIDEILPDSAADGLTVHDIADRISLYGYRIGEGGDIEKFSDLVQFMRRLRNDGKVMSVRRGQFTYNYVRRNAYYI